MVKQELEKSTSDRVLDGGEYDWLRRVTWDFVERTRKSGESYAEVRASVELSRRSLAALSHGEVCGCWRGCGRWGSPLLSGPLVGRRTSHGVELRAARTGATSTQPSKLPRPVYRGGASAESPVGPGRAVC